MYPGQSSRIFIQWQQLLLEQTHPMDDFHTCKCFTLPFVYTWSSNQLTHCVNLSVTWWPQTFNHVCSTSRQIQRCAPSWYQRQFDSSLLWSFCVLVICESTAYQSWTSSISSVTLTCFMLALAISRDVYEHSIHELTMRYSIFVKIHLSRIIPTFL
jgi:hypothetical protein